MTSPHGACSSPQPSQGEASLSGDRPGAVSVRLRSSVAPAVSRAALTRLAGPTRALQHRRIAQLDRQMLAFVYGDARVRDTDLLRHMSYRNVSFSACPDRLVLTPEQLRDWLSGQPDEQITRLTRLLPDAYLAQLMAEPDTAARLVRQEPSLFHHLPASLKTPHRLAALLEGTSAARRQDLLGYIAVEAPELAGQLESVEQALRRDLPGACCSRRDEFTPGQRRWAVTENYMTVAWFSHLYTPEYASLCDLALHQSGDALRFIRVDCRTAARVDRALAHRCPPNLAAIPDNLRTSERLRALMSGPGSAVRLCGINLSCAFLDEHDVWDALKKKPDWLHAIAAEERTEALCRESVSRFPGRLSAIPTAILDGHPEWQAACMQPAALLPLRAHHQLLWKDSLDQEGARALVCASSSYMGILPDGLKAAMPCWAQLLTPLASQMVHLPQLYRNKILEKGTAAGWAASKGSPVMTVEADALLDPMQEQHCSRRSAFLPDLARRKLLLCGPFQLRHKALGEALCQQMDQASEKLAETILGHTLPVWRPDATGGWQQRGGRTLVQQREGRCLHVKLQRQDEPLATLAAEEAAQDFARTHPELGWRSEIPVPAGFFMVPADALPVAQDSFPDKLASHLYQGRRCCLAFCFTTCDARYDSLAWQPDSQGGTRQAEEGLLRAFHDLGVWSSLGAVHTSTICLYHQFKAYAARPELLLTAFFNSGEDYPGKLSHWNSRATEQSDWGWSGLRDLGDLEFYPFITSYVEAMDAEWTLPDYAQRASFVNSIAQNILGGLLHYMRLHRPESCYHYRNAQQLADLARFIERACDNLLEGLLGDGTRLEHLFPANTYLRWRHRSAEEILYWTARQEDPQRGSFSADLDRHRRPSHQIYPGHPEQNLRYPKDFTEGGGENLGPTNRKFPLFFLVRGLYVLAMGLADRLAPSAEKPPAL